MTARQRHGTPRADLALVLVLSLAAGIGDSFAFLALGGIFTANMTGNVVLSTMFTRPDFALTLAGATCALGAFAAAAYASFRVLERSRVRGARNATRRVLVPATLLQAGMALTWASGHDDAERLAAIALAAAVMGCQSAVMKRAAVAGGITTTYVTGTITGIMDDLASGRARVWPRVASILTFVVGGVAGCALTCLDDGLPPWVGFVVMLLAVALAVSHETASARPEDA